MSLPLPQIKKILFTTDLTRQTQHAFNYAAGLAHQYGATLTILYVMEDMPVPQSANLQAFIGLDRWKELQHPMNSRSSRSSSAKNGRGP